MGYLWLLRGTAEQLMLRTVFHAWLYAQRLAVEARIALQIHCKSLRRAVDAGLIFFDIGTCSSPSSFGGVFVCSYALPSMALTCASWLSLKASHVRLSALHHNYAPHRLCFSTLTSGIALQRFCHTLR